MIYNVYTVYDKVAEEAGPPFTAVNDNIAKRMFRNMNIPELIKSDYELRRIGYYDSVNCSIFSESIYALSSGEWDGVPEGVLKLSDSSEVKDE